MTHSISFPEPPPTRPLRRVLLLSGVFLAELLLVAVLYQALARFECQLTGAEGFCFFLRSLPARALALGAVMVLLLLARPGILPRLFSLPHSRPPRRAKWLHFTGVAVLMAPLVPGAGMDLSPWFRVLSAVWLTGAAAAALGGLLWLAPAQAWSRALRPVLTALITLSLLALVLPEITQTFRQIWRTEGALTQITFVLVTGLLTLFKNDVLVDPAELILGAGTFFVRIAPECSGVEGLALVTGFLLLYAVLFRHQIRHLRWWLVVMPLAVLASFVLNVIRITVLVLIGISISPELAVEGFHSYAGWLFFTLLALGLIWAAQSLPWLQRTQAQPVAPDREGLRQDWLAARLLPFIAFMLVSALTVTMFGHPEMAYPLKAAVLALALLLFLPALRRHDWRPALLPLLAGTAVGLGWWLGAGETDEAGARLTAQLLLLPAPLLALWIFCRAAGTMLLVPLVEELVFRGYVLGRLSLPGPFGAGLGLGLSSLLFGLLHGRILAGTLSGLVFGALMLWRGRIADPVWAHIAANSLIAAIALITRDPGLI